MCFGFIFILVQCWSCLFLCFLLLVIFLCHAKNKTKAVYRYIFLSYFQYRCGCKVNVKQKMTLFSCEMFSLEACLSSCVFRREQWWWETWTSTSFVFVLVFNSKFKVSNISLLSSNLERIVVMFTYKPSNYFH